MEETLNGRKKVNFLERASTFNPKKSEEKSDSYMYTFQKDNMRDLGRNIHPAGFKFPAEVLRPHNPLENRSNSSIDRRAMREEIYDYLNLEKNQEEIDENQHFYMGIDKRTIKGREAISDEVISEIDKKILKIRKQREDLLKVRIIRKYFFSFLDHLYHFFWKKKHYSKFYSRKDKHSNREIPLIMNWMKRRTLISIEMA